MAAIAISLEERQKRLGTLPTTSYSLILVFIKTSILDFVDCKEVVRINTYFTLFSNIVITLNLKLYTT